MNTMIVLFFLINITYSTVSASEPLKSFSNSFKNAQKAYTNKDFATAAWQSDAARGMLAVHNLYTIISPDIQDTLEDIIVDSHLAIGKPDLALTDIIMYLATRKNKPEQISYVHKVLINRAGELPSNKKTLQETLAAEALLLQQISTPKNLKENNITTTNALETIEKNSHQKTYFATTQFLSKYAKKNIQIASMLANAYSNKSKTKTLHYAKLFTLNLIRGTDNLPLNRYKLYQFLQNTPDESAHILYTYCQYIELTKAHDTNREKKILSLSGTIKDTQAPLRTLALQLLCNEQQTTQILTSICSLLEKTNPKELCTEFMATDGAFIIPLLEQKAKSHPQATSDLSCFMGMLAYYTDYIDNYYHAYNYLAPLASTLKRDNNIDGLCILLDSFNKSSNVHHEHNANIGLNIIDTIFSLPKKTLKKNKTRLCSLIKEYIEIYTPTLLEIKNHTRALSLAKNCLYFKESTFFGLEIVRNIAQTLGNTNEPIEKKFNQLYSSLAYHIVLQRATKHANPSTQCDNNEYNCIAQIHAYHQILQPNLPLKQNLSYIEHVLKNGLCSKDQEKTLTQLCADFYYQQGKKNKSFTDYQKAAYYGNTYALYKQALLLFEKDLTQDSIETIITLLTTHTNSNDPKRTKSLIVLGDLYLKEHADQKGTFFPKDNLKAFNYYKEAVDLGCNKKAGLVAYFYIHGITNDGIYLIEPNTAQSIEYFNKAIEYFRHKNTYNKNKINQITLNNLLFMRGEAFFRLENYQEALNDLKKVYKKLINDDYKTIALYCMAACQLKVNQSEPSQQKAIRYLSNGYLNQSGFPQDKNLITTEIKDLIQTYLTNSIMHNDLDPKTFELGYALALILYKTTLCHNPEDKQSTKLAIDFLRYATQNNYLHALLTIGELETEYISRWERIDYLDNNIQVCMDLQNNETNTILKLTSLGLTQEKAAQLIAELAPKTIYEMYQYLAHLSIKKNTDKFSVYLKICALSKHLQPKYFLKKENINFTAIKEDKFLDEYLIPLNTSSAQCFSTAQINATTIKALILLQSDQLAHLNLSASYLNKLYITTQQDDFKSPLAYVYYKLAQLNDKEILKIEYLKKSAALGNSNAVITLTKDFLAQNKMTTQLCKKHDLITWLSDALNNPSSMTADQQKTVINLKNKLQPATQTITKPANVQKIISNLQTTNVLAQTIAIHSQTKHPLFKYLVKSINAAPSKEIIQLLNSSASTDKIKTLHKQAHTNNSPDAYMILSATLYHAHDLSAALLYFNNALHCGTTRSDHDSNNVFIYRSILITMMNFITKGIMNDSINPSEEIKTFWKNIKQSLIDYNINTVYFAEYALAQTNYDLDKNPLWNL